MNKDIIVSLQGGIGDALVCTPAIRALKEAHPDRNIIVYSYENKSRLAVFENSPYVSSLRLFNVKSMWRYPFHSYAYLFNRNLVDYVELSFQRVSIHLYEKSIREIVADMFNLQLVHKNIELFLTQAEEKKARELLAPYQNVVLMHIKSRSSSNHHWQMEKWIELVRQLPDYTFIQLGHADEPFVEGAIDWRGKTSLRVAFALVKYCTSFVGVDSGLAHATNAFNTPGVILFGDSDPFYWGHGNNINIAKKTPCGPCYYYLWSDPCPYGHECMHLITVEEVKRALVSQVNKKTKGQLLEVAGQQQG